MSDAANDILRLLSEGQNELVMKFTNESQLAPLRNVLIDVFESKAKRAEVKNDKFNKNILANDKDLMKIINKIDKFGYEWIKTELGIEVAKEEKDMNTVSIGSCAVKETIK